MRDKIKQALSKLEASLSGESNSFYKENVKELIKNSAKKKKAKPLYSAAFLDSSSREELYNWWKLQTKQALHERVPGHSHMTIKFKPSREDILSLPIGEGGEKTVTVIGYSYDELGQAVQVRVSDDSFSRQDDGVAHITISASKEAPRGFAYSNDLLSRDITDVKSGPELKVRIGVFMSNQEVAYDLGDVFPDLDESDIIIENSEEEV